MKQQRIWTMADIKYIREHLHLTDEQIGEYFGVGGNSIRGIRYRNEIRREGEVKHSFKKGHTPHNKGKKMADYISPETLQIMKERLKRGIKKGREVGDIYWYPTQRKMCIKLKDNPRYNYAKYVWEQAHGVKLPTSAGIIHLDGNKRNCDVSNLKLETAADRIRKVQPAQSKYRSKKKPVKMKQDNSYTFHNPYKLSA